MTHMGAFLGFTCAMCAVRHDTHPGPNKPPVWLLEEKRWICFECARKGQPMQANTIGGPVQVWMDMEWVA